VRWVVLAATVLPLIGLGVWYVRPEAYDQIGYYWSTLQFWNEGNVQRSESTMVRVYEFLNIHALLADTGNVLLGMGPGSRFSDTYHAIPFGLNVSAYTFEEIRDRSFENPHGLLPNLMLDTGYGGMLFYLSMMAAMYVLCFRCFRRAGNVSVKAVALSVLAFLPAIVYMSWSPKINMFVGIFLGMVGALRCITAESAAVSPAPVRERTGNVHAPA
jgi:hypothetical protein